MKNLKRILPLLLVVLMFFTTGSTVVSAATKVKYYKHAPSELKLILDGKTVDIVGYVVNGKDTYYAVNDIAKLLKNTTKKFNFKYDTKKKTITVYRGKKFVAKDVDVLITATAEEKKLASKTTSGYFFDRDTVVYVNDKKVSVDALVYSNTFYMKIEDIAKIANFKAKYDKNKKNVSIENVEADSSKLETKVTLGYEGIGEIEDSTGIIQPIYKGGKFVKNPKTTKDFEQLIIYMVNQGISYCNIETNQPYNDLFNYGGLIEVIEDVKFFDDYKKLEYIATFIVDANTLGKGSEITITFRGLSGQDTENYKLKKYYKKIYEVIQELISEGKLTNTMSEKEKAKVLVQWINANVEYAKEEYSTGKIKSERYTGYGALFDGLAVCEGYTRLYMSLCRSVGLYDTYYVVGTATSETTVLGAHAWTVQILDGKKVMTDPTWYNEDGDKYFAITPKEMRKDHIFDINDYLD